MKRYGSSLLMALLVIGMSFGVQAQEELKEAGAKVMAPATELSQGYVKLELTDVSSEDEQMAAMLESMKGSITEVYFDGKSTLTKANMMGGMIQMDNLIDAEGNMTMLFDAMGNKMHIDASKLELDKSKATSQGPMSDLEYEYDKDDVKTIAGYKCYKMTAFAPDIDDPVISGYITEEIKANATLVQGLDMGEWKGFPLEITVSAGPMSLTTKALEVKTEVDAEVFNLSTSGYTKMTWDEFTQSMGRQMGF